MEKPGVKDEGAVSGDDIRCGIGNDTSIGVVKKGRLSGDGDGPRGGLLGGEEGEETTGFQKLWSFVGSWRQALLVSFEVPLWNTLHAIDF